MKRKMVHDKRLFYDRRREPLEDPEWDEAMNSNEEPEYYWFYMSGGGKCIKLYKPSVAALVANRSGLKIVPVKSKERSDNGTAY